MSQWTKILITVWLLFIIGNTYTKGIVDFIGNVILAAICCGFSYAVDRGWIDISFTDFL